MASEEPKTWYTTSRKADIGRITTFVSGSTNSSVGPGWSGNMAVTGQTVSVIPIPYCLAVTPPLPFCDLLPGKREGGGVTARSALLPCS